MANWRDDLSWSNTVFRDEIWPVLSPLIGGGDLVVVEGSERARARSLDILAGIDAWQQFPDAWGVRGIASRIQKGASYRTFTIRFERASGNVTEWTKRMMSVTHLEEGVALPGITLQAYYKRKGVFSGAAVRTIPLYQHIIRTLENAGVPAADLETFGKRQSKELFGFWHQENFDGRSSFIAVCWDKLKEAGVEVVEFEANTPEEVAA